MYHNFFIHSSINGLLGFFHFLTVANSAAMNTGIYVSFRVVAFSGYMPSSGTAGSYGSFTDRHQGSPGSSGEESACSREDTDPIPGQGRSPGEGITTHSSIPGLTS